jgi:hypothetical protein
MIQININYMKKTGSIPIKHSKKSFFFLVDYLEVFSTVKVIMCIFSRQKCANMLSDLENARLARRSELELVGQKGELAVLGL